MKAANVGETGDAQGLSLFTRSRSWRNDSRNDPCAAFEMMRFLGGEMVGDDLRAAGMEGGDMTGDDERRRLPILGLAG